MLNDDPIVALPEGEYYEIEFGNSHEWGYILAKLVLKFGKIEQGKPVQPDVAFITPEVTDGPPKFIYHLSKKVFPAPDLAAALGTKPEVLEKAKRLKLKPFRKPEGLPEPTVSYHGEA